MTEFRKLLAGTLLLAWALAGCADRTSSRGSPPANRCAEGEEACGAECVDLRSDPSHCGACGRECAPHERCEAGDCQACENDLVVCGGRCVDLLSDREHCGGCGKACDGGERCLNGVCSPTAPCPEGQLECGDGCVDPETDDEHCGGCDRACGALATCRAGTCVCRPGSERCGSSCVDTARDPAHCGACDHACGGELICQEGSCACPGEDGSICNGACVNLQVDAEHCGACGRACSLLPFTANHRGCESATCLFDCLEGFGDCDDDWTNGCEAPLESDDQNCGACKLRCSEQEGVSSGFCMAGTCHVSACLHGRADCDGQWANGCEVDILEDPLNCGGCGQHCLADVLPNASGAVCAEGVCTIQCEAPYANCDGDPGNGCEADLENDPNNCGTCGNICDGYCTEGSCKSIPSLGVGADFACIAYPQSKVYCWGSNSRGQLGEGTTEGRSQPTPVVGLVGVQQVAAGGLHACGLKDDSVWCWGDNTEGQLGTGDNLPRTQPEKVIDLEDVVHLSAGLRYTCAVTSGGSVFCWGENSSGQLGDGTIENRNRPVEVQLLPPSNFVSAGFDTTCAVHLNGEASCWGNNENGQFGSGDQITSLSPVPAFGLTDIVQVTSGYGFSCWLDRKGTISCAGNGAQGQLGTGAFGTWLIPTPVYSSETFVSVHAGQNHTCALTATGDASCWGISVYGSMANAPPAYIQTAPVQVSALSSLSLVDLQVFDHSTCSISALGRIHCWGKGQSLLGGAAAQSHVPIEIEAPE